MENVWEVTFSSEHTVPCWGLQSPANPTLPSSAGSPGERKGESPVPFPFPAERLVAKDGLLIPLPQPLQQHEAQARWSRTQS